MSAMLPVGALHEIAIAFSAPLAVKFVGSGGGSESVLTG